uniref:Grctm2 protein n=1 Tax=Biomphalaria glabrata TaxID=6526 RepID=A0A0C9RP66_BIOGL
MVLTELLLTFVLLDSIQTAVSVKYHGDVCSDSASCEVDTTCVLSVDNTTRCLCADDEYRGDRNQCIYINTLLVYNVRTIKVTLNSIKLNWTSQNINYKEAKYNVSYEDTYSLGDESEVTIYNLKSNTLYTFSIQVILFKNQLYKARYGPAVTHIAQTLVKQDSKKPHRELCTKGVDFCQTELLCVQNKNQEYRCLCDKNHYWNDYNECISKSKLSIKNFASKNISSTSVELSWSIDPLHKSSAKFKVWYGGKKNESFPSDVMVATIDELNPITMYTFTIKVEIPADNNYNLTEGPPNICRIQTNARKGTYPNSFKSETTKVTPRTIISTTTLSTTTVSTTTLRSKNKKPVSQDIQFVGHGDLCELANSYCESGTSCVETPNIQYRCLCDDTQYWNKNRMCVPLKSLTVTDAHVIKVTSTSVQLSWSNRSVNKVSVTYSVSYRNKSLAAHPGGVNITNLQPTSNYSFEIFVIIPSELNYMEKRGPGVSISVQTFAENKDPNFENKTPTHQTTTLPTETPSSSKQVLTHTTLANTASGQSNTNTVIVVIVVLLVLAVVLIVMVVLVVRRKNSKRKNSTQILLDKYDKCRNTSQPELVYTELEPNTYSTSQDTATNTVSATNHNLPTSSNGASSPSVYYNIKAQEEFKVEMVYSHLSHFKEQERENPENIYDG